MALPALIAGGAALGRGAAVAYKVGRAGVSAVKNSKKLREAAKKAAEVAKKAAETAKAKGTPAAKEAAKKAAAAAKKAAEAAKANAPRLQLQLKEVHALLKLQAKQQQESLKEIVNLNAKRRLLSQGESPIQSISICLCKWGDC